jgi:8-oxo-dGTP pyrophosphatase MutT (NUDIX family)
MAEQKTTTAAQQAAPPRVDLLDLETAGTQFAALCYRTHKDRTQVLLITSRDTGRWIVPKGWPIDGLSPAAAAAQEAFEEAGVRGRVHGRSIGQYSYHKVFSRREDLPCLVAVFPVEVRELARKFPEKGQRRRKWFTPEQAATLVQEPELAEILRGFRPAALEDRAAE